MIIASFYVSQVRDVASLVKIVKLYSKDLFNQVSDVAHGLLVLTVGPVF